MALLYLSSSSACTCGTHPQAPRPPPSLIKTAGPCTHQNSESEPPSIERHRHLIFFSCHLLLKSSPKLTRIPSHLFIFFPSSTWSHPFPSFPFLFSLSQTRHYHSQRIGPRRVRRNWSRCFYPYYFLHLEIQSPRLRKSLLSPSLLPSTSDQVTGLPFSIPLLFTHTTPHITRDGALNVCWRSRFSVSSTRESVSQKKVRQPQGSDETFCLSGPAAGRAEWRLRLTSTAGLVL